MKKMNQSSVNLQHASEIRKVDVNQYSFPFQRPMQSSNLFQSAISRLGRLESMNFKLKFDSRKLASLAKPK